MKLIIVGHPPCCRLLQYFYAFIEHYFSQSHLLDDMDVGTRNRNFIVVPDIIPCKMKNIIHVLDHIILRADFENTEAIGSYDINCLCGKARHR